MLEKNKRRLRSIEYDIEKNNEKLILLQEKMDKIWAVLCDLAEVAGCRITIEAAQPKRYVVTMKGGEQNAKNNSDTARDR